MRTFQIRTFSKSFDPDLREVRGVRGIPNYKFLRSSIAPVARTGANNDTNTKQQRELGGGELHDACGCVGTLSLISSDSRFRGSSTIRANHNCAQSDSPVERFRDEVWMPYAPVYRQVCLFTYWRCAPIATVSRHNADRKTRKEHQNILTVCA